MNRRDARLALGLNVLLASLLLLSFASGWAASLMGLTEFGLHKYTSIALIAATIVHIGLHHRSLTRHHHKPRIIHEMFGPNHTAPATIHAHITPASIALED